MILLGDLLSLRSAWSFEVEDSAVEKGLRSNCEFGVVNHNSDSYKQSERVLLSVHCKAVFLRY